VHKVVLTTAQFHLELHILYIKLHAQKKTPAWNMVSIYTLCRRGAVGDGFGDSCRRRRLRVAVRVSVGRQSSGAVLVDRLDKSPSKDWQRLPRWLWRCGQRDSAVLRQQQCRPAIIRSGQQ